MHIMLPLFTVNRNFPKGFDIFMIIAYTDRIIITILMVLKKYTRKLNNRQDITIILTGFGKHTEKLNNRQENSELTYGCA